jgi:hypothetical protein
LYYEAVSLQMYVFIIIKRMRHSLKSGAFKK